MEERRKQETGETEHFVRKTADGLIGDGGETKKRPPPKVKLLPNKTNNFIEKRETFPCMLIAEEEC